MTDIVVGYNDITEQLLWESFMTFFRNVKGYSDWTDEQIAISMNKDDLNEYFTWVKGVLMNHE